MLAFAVSAQALDLNFIKFGNAEIEKSKLYQKGNIYQRDFLLFVDVISSLHPAFAPGERAPFDVEKVRKDGSKWAVKSTSKEALSSYMQAIISPLYDGHTAIVPNYNASKIYPFRYYRNEDEYILAAVSKEFESHLRKQIVKINDTPIGDVIESFRYAVSYDNEVSFRKSVRNDIALQSIWANNRYRRADSLLKLTFADGSAIELKAVEKKNAKYAYYKPQIKYSTVRKRSAEPFLYQILTDKSIAYLQFRQFDDQAVQKRILKGRRPYLSEVQIDSMVAKAPRFDTLIENMFAKIEANGIKTLVVDVRGNGGGNSALSDVLLSWLKPIEQIKTGGCSIRVSPFWETFYPKLAADYRAGFAKAGKEYKLGELYDTGKISSLRGDTVANYLDFRKLFPTNNDPQKIFKGNVVFIQNEGTYSSAGGLIILVTDNKIGTVVGTESSYRPCNYGDLLTWELPNTGIKGGVSHKYFTRPDKSRCGELSIKPEIELTGTMEDILAGRDLYWEWIVERYGK